LQDKKESIA